MKEHYTDVQNQFTAYLVASVIKKRASYLKRMNWLRKKEYIQADFLDSSDISFDREFEFYINEMSAEAFEDPITLQGILKMIGEDNLLKAIASLKERERVLLFGRVFGELGFSELGKKLNLSPKQAEMAYYYVIRKIRKKLGGTKDGF